MSQLNRIDVTTHGGLSIAYEYKGYRIDYSMITGPRVTKDRKTCFTKHGAGFRDLHDATFAIDEGDIKTV